MKAIINGKRYDTSTARKVGTASYGYAGDFHAWRATLYRTPRGNYFIAGSGGPLTQFSERTPDGGYNGSSKIIPMSMAQAQEWAEDHLDVDCVEQEFGESIEDA